MLKRLVTIAGASLWMAGISAADAAIITYTNQATFLAALASSTTENFEGFAAGTVITNQLSGITTVSTNGDNGSTQAQIGSIAALPFPMTNGLPTSSGDRFLSSELAGPVFATAGLNFALAANNDGVGFFVVDGVPLGNFGINLFNGATLVDSAVFGPQTLPDSFIGVISTVAFNTVKIDAVNPGDSWGIDDLSIGSIGQVPEPATLALFGLGLAGLAVSRRRKQ